MFDQLLDIISQQHTPGFFVTAECTKQTEELPADIPGFIQEKLNIIDMGVTSRKFVYSKDGWRIIFTFFPTDQLVDEKYALKNKVYKHR